MPPSRKHKPVAAWLPGRYGKMAREQLDAESDHYNTEFSATRAEHVVNTRPHPGKPARPPKSSMKRPRVF